MAALRPSAPLSRMLQGANTHTRRGRVDVARLVNSGRAPAQQQQQQRADIAAVRCGVQLDYPYGRPIPTTALSLV